jgi:hypothetical protein
MILSKLGDVAWTLLQHVLVAGMRWHDRRRYGQKDA